MAISKIIHMNSAENRNPAVHLQNAIEYIQNPDKTEKLLLVGSFNCLPEIAFEQMMETKKIFQKTDKRQGYHIVLALKPGEGTPEIAFDIARRFTEEFLGDRYEAVYTVHVDKEHIHSHVIWNSVSLLDGRKYDYKKGDWKRVIQPITNKLCEEYGLSIIEAEYVKDSQNLSRKEWKFEQAFKEMIYRDAMFCSSYAGSMEHFLFLMQRLGYEFKPKEYLTVKMPGRKLYHRLDKLDNFFAEDRFKYCFEYTSAHIPHFYSTDPTWKKQSNMSPYQKQFYGKLYRLRMVEHKRFYAGSAKYAKDLMIFHKVQEEYLFLTNNNIRTIDGLVDDREKKLARIDEISRLQHSIYTQNAIKKRACKTDEDWRVYQQWWLEEYGKLDQLKVEKKEVKKIVAIAERCLGRKLDTEIDDILEQEEVFISNKVQVPEFVDEIKVQTEVVKTDVYSEPEQIFTDPVSIQTQLQLQEQLFEIEHQNVEVATSPSPEPLPDTFASYCLLSVEEKVKRYQMTGKEDAYGMVETYFKSIRYPIYFGEVYDEAKELEKAFKFSLIEAQADFIVVQMLVDGINPELFPLLSMESKARYFEFDMTDNKYNLELYKEVMKKMELKLSNSELFEGYQEIYETKMTQQADRTHEKKWDKSR